MRTILRLLLLIIFIFSLSLFLHVGAFHMFMSSGDFSSITNNKKVYESLTASVNEQMAKDSQGETPVTFTPEQIQSVVAPLLNQSIEYIQGKSTVIPTVSTKDLMARVSGGNKEIMQQLEAMKKEMLTSTPTNADEIEQQKNFVSFMSQADKGISFEKQLLALRAIYLSLAKLRIIAFVGMIVPLLLIIIFSPDGKSKALWIGLTGILTGLVMGVGAFIYTLPTVILSKLSAEGGVQSVAAVFLIPFIEKLARFHVAATVICFAIGIIGILARVMVFKTPQVITPSTKGLEKK